VPVPLYQAKADFFRTLGHPARIRILELLSDRDHARPRSLTTRREGVARVARVRLGGCR
jgi:DNA-binding transcriptional ArsR family regulator